ncbi:MAG: hypothetical protein HZA49_03625 [Planctomycetes bacterium]|nr:hypothetical protein [Planctomycetota bacterium]
MATKVSGVRLVIPETNPPADYMAEQWRDSLKNNAMRINQKRQQAVPDEGKFQTKLAAPSGLEWAKVMDPTYRSKSELSADDIRTAQMRNLMDAFSKWELGLAYAFETVDGVEAKRFKDAVDNKSDSWADGVTRKTLRFTGDKVRGRGAAPIAAYWLAGDKRVGEMLRAGDTVTTGGPINVAKVGFRTFLKTGLVQRLIQSGVVIVRSGYDPAVIGAQNGFINEFLKGVQDAAFAEFQPLLLPDKSFCRYELTDGVLYLNIQVVTP